MENVTMMSNHIKYKTCKKCKDRLKGVLLDEQLQLFEDTFYEIAKNYVFKEKGELEV